MLYEVWSQNVTLEEPRIPQLIVRATSKAILTVEFHFSLNEIIRTISLVIKKWNFSKES